MVLLKYSRMLGELDGSSMASTNYDFCSFLRSLELSEDFIICPELKTEVRTLILKANSLKIFLSCRGIWNIEDQKLKALLFHIQTVFQHADQDLRLLWSDFIKLSSRLCWCVPLTMDVLLSRTLESLELLNPYIQQVYTIVITSKSLRSNIGYHNQNDEAVRENLNELFEIIECLMRWKFAAGLIAPLKEELEAVKKCLRFFMNFLGFTAKRCTQIGKFKDLLILAEFLVTNISCLLFLCSPNHKVATDDHQMANRREVQLLSELQRFFSAAHQQDVRLEIYTKSLRPSKKSAQKDLILVDETDLGFLDSLRDYILELPIPDANKDQILFLHQELRYLTVFLAMDPSLQEKYRYQETYIFILKRINALITEMGCVIYSLSLHIGKEDRELGMTIAMEMEIVLSNMQEIINTIKEDARKGNKTLWHLKPPIRVDWEAFDESDSVGPLKHQIEVAGKEFRSLSEALGKFTRKLCSQPEELRIEYTHIIIDISVRLNIVSSSLFSGNDKFEIFSFTEEIKEIRMKIEDLQNKINGGKIREQINRFNLLRICEIDAQLSWLQMNVDLTYPLQDEVKTLQLKVSFLKVFLNCKGKWQIEDRYLKFLLTRIGIVFQNAAQDLRRLWADLVHISSRKGNCLPVSMDSQISGVLERFEHLNTDFHQVYTILSESSRFVTGMSQESILGCLNFLLENIDDLLRCKAELVAPMKNELKVVKKNLKFLRSLHVLTSKRCNKLGKLKDLLIHVETFVDNISCLLYQCSDDKMNSRIANKLKLHLLSELQKFSAAQPTVRMIYIKALQASNSATQNFTSLDQYDLGFLDSIPDYLLLLPETKLKSMDPTKDLIFSLREEIRFLITYFAMDLSLDELIENDQMFGDLFESMSVVIHEIGHIICSIHDDENSEDVDRELYEKVSDLQTIVAVAKEDARKMYDLYVPKSLRYDFPRTNAQGFIDTLLQNLSNLLSLSKTSFGASLKYHIDLVQEEVLSMSEEFSNISKQPNRYCEELKNQWNRFTDIAYHTEYIIDSSIGGEGDIYCHKLGLFNVIEEIKEIRKEIKAIKDKNTDETLLEKASCIPNKISLEANSTEKNAMLSTEKSLTEELVIFEDKAEAIMEALMNGTQVLYFLSIVGMPGIGKTTLGHSVYQRSLTTRHFHVTARCTVGQVHDKQRLLLEILQEITGQKHDYHGDDLDEKLYRCLKCRRYLIFMDDIWNIQAWKDIKASFPDDENGSRIMFTSRFHGIASHTGSASISYHLSPLPIDKSWKMLQKKLFENKHCPQELVSVGQEVAASCKGLPLAIDLIAGILRVTKATKWKKVAETMNTHLFDDPQGRCQRVLELSYQDLPDDMKPCFLYFAAFPADADVPTWKLILFWMAEGFIYLQSGDQRTLEDAAEDVLNNLIARSLVTVSERRALGGVKASHVHDLLHEFALVKSQEERFMLKTEGKAMLSDGYQWGDEYRLCINSDPNWEKFLGSNHCCPRARTLISESCLNFNYFKLLRVLDITRIYIRESPTIFTLIHLRFLAVTMVGQGKILSEIHKLENLETFIMIGRDKDEYLLLDKISNMVRLRHIRCTRHISLRYSKEKSLENWFAFDNLRSIYHLKVSYAEEIEKILRLMPSLQKLKVSFYNPDGGFYPFPRLDILEKLEFLKVENEDCSRLLYACKITSFPPYLKTLIMKNFHLKWDEISEIGNLEYLQVLKLKHNSFEGPIWDMADGQFPKLRYLSLHYLDLEQWNASEDHLSCLEELHLEYCVKLEELPSCLAQITTLQRIVLTECNSSTQNSAHEIKQEQVDGGNDGFVLNVYNLSPVPVFDVLFNLALRSTDSPGCT